MSQIGFWFKNFTWKKVWGAEESELKWTLRVFIATSSTNILYQLYIFYKFQTALQYTQDVSIPFSESLLSTPIFYFILNTSLTALTLAACASQSFWGWVGLVIFAAQMLSGPLFLLGLGTIYWLVTGVLKYFQKPVTA